jgi:tetratricopeptide (TPR) repeat protein
MRESLAILSASLGEEHPMSAHCRDSWGGILNALDRYDEALPLLERALADRRRALGEDHDKVGLTLKNLAVNGLGRGDFESAIEDGAAAVAILQNNAGLAFELSVAQLALAEARLATGDHGEGVREGIEKSMAIREGVPIEEAWMIADAERVMALWVLRQGESADPAEMLQSAMDRLECDKATNPYQCDRVHGQIDALLNELK